MAIAFEQLAAWKVKNTFIDWDEEDSEVQKHSCRRVFATCPDLVRAATEPSQDCMEPEAEATPTRWNDMSDSELEPAEEKSPEHACSPSKVHVGSPSSREAGDASVANRSKRRGRGGRSHRGGVARSSAFEVREGTREGERCDPARQQKLRHELQQLLQQQQQQQQQQQHQQNPLNDHEWPSLGGHTSKEKSQAPSDPRSCQTGAASVAASSTPHVPPTWGVSSVSKENSPSLQPHAQTTSVKSVAAKERNARGSLWCHLFISPDMLRPGFDLNKKIIGKGGCYTRGIYEATGAKIRLRGHGSGHLERDGQEAPASLMLAITVETGEAAPFCEAIRMAAELLQGIARRFRSFCGRRGSSEVGRGQPPSATLFWIGELSHRGKLCAAALAEELGLPLP
eukprot:CAMPEP_0177312244 /NCGR_PEP_ID=MMETSP0368-20130122/10782_1 /TAXON_ID=447022 ORGANISM="Scrippsiella hangoei-like, Strain SHHI-4" /NCGR_SAMPLE_ID=MMETSP0368 /ASSEMBLY_ACC=CAM_ASM_000363 /LENGTH=396 /DNA_ID=CAMNT_0018771283 /DNA_START=60 /DNA_END=1250 /DNA_ORIENTATION=+